ncbi:hypothetical protein AB2881_32410, partial [Escherichia coli]
LSALVCGIHERRCGRGAGTVDGTALSRVSSLLDWVPGVRAIAVKCDLCHFDDQGPACVRTCPTNALMLVDSRDIAQ